MGNSSKSARLESKGRVQSVSQSGAHRTTSTAAGTWSRTHTARLTTPLQYFNAYWHHSTCGRLSRYFGLVTQAAVTPHLKHSHLSPKD